MHYRDTALLLMEIVSNSYVQTYNTKEEAETFLKSVNVKTTRILTGSNDNDNVSESRNQLEASASNPTSIPSQSSSSLIQQIDINPIQLNMAGIKRKRAEKEVRKEARLVVKDNIKKVYIVTYSN